MSSHYYAVMEVDSILIFFDKCVIELTWVQVLIILGVAIKELLLKKDENMDCLVGYMKPYI